MLGCSYKSSSVKLISDIANRKMPQFSRILLRVLCCECCKTFVNFMIGKCLDFKAEILKRYDSMTPFARIQMGTDGPLQHEGTILRKFTQ